MPKIEITTPNVDDDTATFNTANPGLVVIGAGVDVTPAAFISELVWNITGMDGSSMQIIPGPTLDTVDFVFTTLPPDQKQFAKIKRVYASIPSWNSIDSARVKIFFPMFNGQQFAFNHSGGHLDEPNWFYYWKQTSAGRAVRDGGILVPYGYEGADCDLSKRGYYNFGEPKFYICESGGMFCQIDCAQGDIYTGIDLFAVTVRHEAGRYEDYRNMWWLPYGLYVNSLDNDPWNPHDPLPPGHPPDGDYVPDNIEGLGHQYPQFNPLKSNTDYPADHHEDFEDLGFDRECPSNWTKGQADSEDWANPGHIYDNE